MSCGVVSVDEQALGTERTGIRGNRGPVEKMCGCDWIPISVLDVQISKRNTLMRAGRCVLT